MAGGVGYYADGYWNANYWQANYWTEGAAVVPGQYWAENYWHANYWDPNYWLDGAGSPGDIFQTAAIQLSLNGQQATAGAHLNVQSTTASLALAEQLSDANLDIDPAVTSPNLPWAVFQVDAVADGGGYQAGDIDINFIPDSAIGLTQGVIVNTPGIPLVPMVHTISETGGVAVAVSFVDMGSFNPFLTDSRLDISVEPLPEAIPLNSFSTTAGIGQQIPATLESIELNVATHTIVATETVIGDVISTTAGLALTGANAMVAGISSGSVDDHIFVDGTFDLEDTVEAKF